MAQLVCEQLGKFRPIREFVNGHIAPHYQMRGKLCIPCNNAHHRDLHRKSDGKWNAIYKERYATDPQYRELKRVQRKAYRTRNAEEIKAKRYERYHADPKAAAAIGRDYRANNVERQRAYFRKYYYGLDQSTYEAMITRQSGRCAICKCSPKKLVVDHNHETGAVRGLLCSPCNLGIGHFRESTGSLVAAALYLRATTCP